MFAQWEEDHAADALSNNFELGSGVYSLHHTT